MSLESGTTMNKLGILTTKRTKNSVICHQILASSAGKLIEAFKRRTDVAFMTVTYLPTEGIMLLPAALLSVQIGRALRMLRYLICSSLYLIPSSFWMLIKAVVESTPKLI